MATVNLLVMLHGMTLEGKPRDHSEEYKALWSALQAKQPRLTNAIGEPIKIEYGHEPQETPLPDLRNDQLITRAENFINDRTSYAKVRSDPSPYNHLLDVKDELGDLHLTEVASKWLLRPYILTPFKEKVMVRGFTDALYYCSPDGERAIRRAVYTQFLEGLDEHVHAEQVRLHVIAQSLGVTVAFDFLFGLFAPDDLFPDNTPGFIRENEQCEGMRIAVEAYRKWRQRRKEGRLVLGSKSSTGGQLPLMMMRKQSLVNRMARGERLEASVIGIEKGDQLKWKIFYDADDALGFPIRRIFEEQAAIQEYEVNTHWQPDLAHSLYWEHEMVQDEIAILMVQNLEKTESKGSPTF